MTKNHARRICKLLLTQVVVLLAVVLTPTRSRAIETPDPTLSAAAPAAVVSIHDIVAGPTAANQTCTGVLISTRHVLTAGHCMLDAWFTRVAVVVNNRDGARTYRPAAIKIIGSYNDQTRSGGGLMNDLAVITLERDVAGVSPVALPKSTGLPSTGLVVYGWGLDGGGKNHGTLGAQRLRLHSGVQAGRPWFDSSTQFSAYGISAAGKRYEAVCDGDSGGPVLHRAGNGPTTVVGIVSYGGDCRLDATAVYVKVGKYLKWINSIIMRAAR